MALAQTSLRDESHNVDETETTPPTYYQKRNGHFSVSEVSDFDKYLRGTPEHRNGDFTTTRLSLKKPMRIIFFGDGPRDPIKAEYELVEDINLHTLVVTCVKGDQDTLTKYLDEYGLVALDPKIIAEKPADVIRLMNSPEILEFIEEREIRPEDLRWVEQALQIPREIYILDHNTIAFEKENSELYFSRQEKSLNEKLANVADDVEHVEKLKTKLKYAQIMQFFCHNYNWAVARHLNSIMEEIAPKNI